MRAFMNQVDQRGVMNYVMDCFDWMEDEFVEGSFDHLPAFSDG